jgi:hypothetical protein
MHQNRDADKNAEMIHAVFIMAVQPYFCSMQKNPAEIKSLLQRIPSIGIDLLKKASGIHLAA